MFQSTVPVLFESSDNFKAFQDPANEEWVAVLRTIEGEDFETLERRYYLALQHFRKQPARPTLTGNTEIPAQGKQQAFQAVLETMDQRKAAGLDAPEITRRRSLPSRLPGSRPCSDVAGT